MGIEGTPKQVSAACCLYCGYGARPAVGVAAGGDFAAGSRVFCPIAELSRLRAGAIHRWATLRKGRWWDEAVQTAPYGAGLAVPARRARIGAGTDAAEPLRGDGGDEG